MVGFTAAQFRFCSLLCEGSGGRAGDVYEESWVDALRGLGYVAVRTFQHFVSGECGGCPDSLGVDIFYGRGAVEKLWSTPAQVDAGFPSYVDVPVDAKMLQVKSSAVGVFEHLLKWHVLRLGGGGVGVGGVFKPVVAGKAPKGLDEGVLSEIERVGFYMSDVVLDEGGGRYVEFLRDFASSTVDVARGVRGGYGVRDLRRKFDEFMLINPGVNLSKVMALLPPVEGEGEGGEGGVSSGGVIERAEGFLRDLDKLVAEFDGFYVEADGRRHDPSFWDFVDGKCVEFKRNGGVAIAGLEFKKNRGGRHGYRAVHRAINADINRIEKAIAKVNGICVKIRDRVLGKPRKNPTGTRQELHDFRGRMLGGRLMSDKIGKVFCIFNSGDKVCNNDAANFNVHNQLGPHSFMGVNLTGKVRAVRCQRCGLSYDGGNHGGGGGVSESFISLLDFVLFE